MAGLLYSAYQKFYSALKNLQRFDKENNFFDNISSLDSFLSEYRSITFVLQKSLAHTPYIERYRELAKERFTDSWMNTQRVKTVHEHPVEFSKQIDVSIYLPFGKLVCLRRTFTVDNDIPLSSCQEELKKYFCDVSEDEVFFSAKFSFIEKDSGKNIWNKLSAGIFLMGDLMETLYQEIAEQCPLCETLRKQIQENALFHVPDDFLLVSDYVYYPRTDEFERAGRLAIVLGINGRKVANRMPITFLTEDKHLNYDGTTFGTFVLMHAIIPTLGKPFDIMPAILVVYGDGTYDLDAFHADIKTTVYRKLSEVAELIETKDVKEVCFMNTYSVIPSSKEVPTVSKERLKLATHDILAFMKVDSDLNETEYAFDSRYYNRVEYVACNMQHCRKDRLEIGKLNMMPIVYAFSKKREGV